MSWHRKRPPTTCQAGWDFATGSGTVGYCEFRATWRVSNKWRSYILCGIHKNAALRDSRDYVAERLTLDEIKGVAQVATPATSEAQRAS